MFDRLECAGLFQRIISPGVARSIARVEIMSTHVGRHGTGKNRLKVIQRARESRVLIKAEHDARRCSIFDAFSLPKVVA